MTIYTVLGPGGYSRPPYGSFAGKPAAPMGSTFVTNTALLTLPIDVVIAGQQPSDGQPNKRAERIDGVSGVMASIFNE